MATRCWQNGYIERVYKDQMAICTAQAHVWSLVACLCFALPAASQNGGGSRPESYAKLCASCHGEAATGTERGPSLMENRALHSRTEKQIHDLIQNGSPGRMPPFALPEEQLQALARWVRSLNVSAFDSAPAGDRLSGERFFFGKGQCGSCHMVRGRGEAKGPDLSGIGRELTLVQLEQALDDPAGRAANRPDASCPGWAWCPGRGWSTVTVKLNDGSSLRGLLRSEGKHDLQVQTLDLWLEQQWLVPEQTSTGMNFSDMDVARARLIWDLKKDFGVNDEGVDVILHLVDQLHGLRRALEQLQNEFQGTSR